MPEAPSIYDTGIYKAVEKAGGASALGGVLGVSRQIVYAWLKRGFVPPLRAIQLEEMFGIHRAELMDQVLMRGSLADATNPSGRAAYRPRI